MNESNKQLSCFNILNRSLSLQTVADLPNVYDQGFFFTYVTLMMIGKITISIINVCKFCENYELVSKCFSIITFIFLGFVFENGLFYLILAYIYDDWNGLEVIMLINYSSTLPELLKCISVLIESFNIGFSREGGSQVKYFKSPFLTILYCSISIISTGLFFYTIFILLRNNMRARQNLRKNESKEHTISPNTVTFNIAMDAEKNISDDIII